MTQEPHQSYPHQPQYPVQGHSNPYASSSSSNGAVGGYQAYPAPNQLSYRSYQSQQGYQQTQQPQQPYQFQQPAQQFQAQQSQSQQIPVIVPQPAAAMTGGMQPVTQPFSYAQVDDADDDRARRGGCWRVVFIAALLVLIASLAAAGYIIYSYWHGQAEYDEIAQHMTITPEDGVTTLGSFDVDWDALRAINSDVVAWVYVPDTIINYPVVWRENDDKYYLKHNFGDNSAGDFAAEYGCVMLAGINKPDFTDEINVIYGHNLNNGSMFSVLGENMNTDNFNAHRTIYLLTPKGNYKLTSFAVNKVKGSSTEIVIPNFGNEEAYLAYVEKRIADSPVDPSPRIPAAKDIEQVFAFSTCNEPDNTYRIITFCYPAEFLPAGSDVEDGKSLVDEDDVANVEDVVGNRLS